MSYRERSFCCDVWSELFHILDEDGAMIFERRQFLQSAASAALLSGAGAETVLAHATNEPAATVPYPAPTDVHALQIASLEELEEAAASLLPVGAFAYIARGSDNEWTLRQNREAFALPLNPHSIPATAGSFNPPTIQSAESSQLDQLVFR